MPSPIVLLIFPAGLSVVAMALFYEWLNRKLVARLQNRIGPRWIQPTADLVKLLAKEEIIPDGVDSRLFLGLPVIALAGALTAAVYVPLYGLPPPFGFEGDLIVVVYLLSLLSICLGVAGSNTPSRFSLIGATRTLTQLFSYEAPFLLALLGPAIAADSWNIGEITEYASSHWMILTQPIGFVVAIVGLMGKLELPPFDAPEAHTEIVAGAFTEYSGRGFALFRLAKDVELLLGLTLISSFYLGGLGGPIEFVVKTLVLMLAMGGLQTLFARLRIDQTVGLWWRYGALAALGQLLLMIGLEGVA